MVMQRVRVSVILALLLLISLFTFSSYSYAYDNTLTVRIHDVSTREPLSQAQVTYTFYDKILESEHSASTILDEDGMMSIILNGSQYTLEIRYDDMQTPGKDLYYMQDIHIGPSMIDVYMLPIGSLKGSVVDKDGRRVKDALVRFDCISEYGIQGITHTDDMGSFSSSNLPIGSCRIGSAYGDTVGFKDVEITRGGISDITIQLDTQVSNGQGQTWFVSISVIVTIVSATFVIYMYRKSGNGSQADIKHKTDRHAAQRTDTRHKTKTIKRANAAKGPVAQMPGMKNSRAEDILATLKDNERSVVRYLLDNGHESSMAKIYYTTAIPKTSLSRVLDGLEHKNIITTSRLGKLRKIRLTDWFLGKSP